jgi:chaperone LolA
MSRGFPHGFRLILPLLGALLAAPLPAAGETAEQVLTLLAARYARVETLRAAFVQREKVAVMGQTRELEGTLVLGRPGRMRWEYLRPERRLVVCDGQTLWFYQEDARRAWRYEISASEIGRTPLALLFSKEADLGRYYRPTSLQALDGDRLRLDLTPLPGSGEVRSLGLTVRKGEWTILGTEMKDPFGNRTELILGEMREQVAVDSSLFRFTPPRGTEIIDGGGR